MSSGPALILVMGVAGSGKTTLARGILKKLHATYLDNNFVADAFYRHTRVGKAYAALRPRFYRILYRIAEENLMAGNSVLLDVPHVKEMRDPEWRSFLSSTVARTKAVLIVLRCFLPEDMLKQRIKSRGEARDARKLARWDAFMKEQPIKVAVPFKHLDIDSTNALARNVDHAVRYILRRQRERARRQDRSCTRRS